MKDKYINNSKENKNYTIRNKYVRLIFILMHLTFFVVMMIYYEKNKLIFCYCNIFLAFYDFARFIKSNYIQVI